MRLSFGLSSAGAVCGAAARIRSFYYYYYRFFFFFFFFSNNGGLFGTRTSRRSVFEAHTRTREFLDAKETRTLLFRVLHH
jgi:hypothetical protein